MDDKENRAPPLSMEMKRERMLQKLQRRNSAASSKDFLATSSVVTKGNEGEMIETKALVAWINVVLAPPGDDVDASGRSELETLLGKENCGKQLKKMLGCADRHGADAHKREPSGGGKLSQTNSNSNSNGEIRKYFMKNASHAKLAKRLEKEVNEEVLGAIQCLVMTGKIRVREEIKVHTNLGVQAALCQALLSFQPVWLRLALEFVCGRPVQLTCGDDSGVRYVADMSAYIQRYLFADYDILGYDRKFYNGNNKRMLTKAGIDAIQKNFLSKFLCILYLIQWMLIEQLLPDVPCMFWVSSKLKSINDVLSLLSREVLSGGSAVKPLQQAGFFVCYQQGFFEEYKYVVKNLQTDLGDGIILAKIVEVLAAKRGKPIALIGGLRNPSGDRLRKISNVRSVLNECSARFPDQFSQQAAEFKADDVVAGKRDVLVELVWRLIGVVLGDEVTELRREFVAKYHAVITKPQSATAAVSSDCYGLELPFLVEMRRLNAIASRIQAWWRRRHTIRVMLAKVRKIRPVIVSVLDADQSANDVQPLIQQHPETETTIETAVEPPEISTDDFDEKTICDETENKSVDENDEVGDAAGVASDGSLLNTSDADMDGAVRILQSMTINSGCRIPSAVSNEEPEDEEAYATANESYGSAACRDLLLDSLADHRLSSTSYADQDLSVVNDRSVGAELTFLPDTIESVTDDFVEEVIEAITVTTATSVEEPKEEESVEEFESIVDPDRTDQVAEESGAPNVELGNVDTPTSSLAAVCGPKSETKNDGYESSAMLDKALNITANTLVARQIAAVGLFNHSRTNAQSDCMQSDSSLTFEEFSRNLDKRRHEMRLVGIPMRKDPLMALKKEPKASGSQLKPTGSQSKTDVQQPKTSELKSNIPRPKPASSNQKQPPKFK